MSNKKENDKEHLPLYGVGPIIVFGQFFITVLMIVIIYIWKIEFAYIAAFNIPFKILGVALIIGGFYLDISAKFKSKMFEKVAENILITDGVYGIVRNPVYGGMLIVCTGTVLMFNNLILLIAPIICWIYDTVFLVNTEEKWLKDLYGEKYIDYCRRVNRLIPWFSRKKV